MKNNEEKRKVGRPKLADSRTKKMAIISIVISISAVIALSCGFLLSVNNTNASKLKGVLNISDCDISVYNIKEETAKLSWKCSSGKIKAYSVYLTDDEGNIVYKLPFSTKISAKQTGSTTIKRLSPGTQYVVKALTSDNKFVKTDSFFTEGDAKLKIKAKSITSNSLTVNWDSTSLKSSAKKIILTLPFEDGEEPEIIGSKTAFTQKGVKNFTKLKPETEYFACVQLRDDTTQCEVFKTKDEYNVTAQSALNSVTVTWGAKSAKLTKIEIFDAVVDYESDEDEKYIYDETNPIKTKNYDKPKKSGVYTATKLNHGVNYVVKATFDDGKEIIKKKKVLSSHKYYVGMTDKNFLITWADSKSAVTNIMVTLLDENDEDEDIVFEQSFDEPKKSGYQIVPDLAQDRYYRISIAYEDKSEPVTKIVKTLYAYNILVLPGSTTATVTWGNTSSSVTSIVLEKIDEEDTERLNSELIYSKEYSKTNTIGLYTFKNLEPKTAYSITVTYEDGTKTKEEFKTLPKININEDSSVYKILDMLKNSKVK